MQARGEGEVGKGGDVVVCEVDCVLVLYLTRHQHVKRAQGAKFASLRPLRRPGSQSRVFCGLRFLENDINGAHPKV